MNERQYVDIRLTPELLDVLTLCASFVRSLVNGEVSQLSEKLLDDAVRHMLDISPEIWQAFMRESSELTLALGRSFVVAVKQDDGSFLTVNGVPENPI